MKFDNLVKCSRCSSDSCYIQDIPPTMIRLDYCFGCGFQSSPAYSEPGNLDLHLKHLPNIYKLLMDQEEDTLKIWMPVFINIPGNGIIYANGRSREDWWWEVAKYDKVLKDKMKIEDIKRFPSEKGFMDALELLGLFEK